MLRIVMCASVGAGWYHGCSRSVVNQPSKTLLSGKGRKAWNPLGDESVTGKERCYIHHSDREKADCNSKSEINEESFKLISAPTYSPQIAPNAPNIHQLRTYWDWQHLKPLDLVSRLNICLNVVHLVSTHSNLPVHPPTLWRFLLRNEVR